MKSVTTSSASDAIVMNAADSNRDGTIAFGSGSQRRIRILTRQESIMPGVQSGEALRTDSPENTSPASGGNKKCSVSKKSGKEVPHADVNSQDMHPLESLSPEGTSSGLSDRAINVSNSKEISLFPSDPVITAAEENHFRSGIRSRSTVELRNSNPEIWIENQLKEQPDKTGKILSGVDIPTINLTAQEKNPVLKRFPDVGFVEKSPLIRIEPPKDLMARSRSECTGTQSSAPDFSPDSGARPKTVPATSRKKQKKSKKNTGNRAGSNFVKDTAITSPIHSAAIAFVQDETGEEKAATTRQPIKKQPVQPASLSQQLLQAGRNELMAFDNEIKELFDWVSSAQWARMDEITKNLKRVDPLFENLIQEYETLADTYPASSIDRHKSGKTGNNCVDGVLFTYSHRSDVAVGFCCIVREMIGSIGAFLISDRKCEKYHGSLLEPMLKMICVWLRFVMECRINDWQAIYDRGEGMFAVDITDSGSSGNRMPLKSQMKEPRYDEKLVNKVFYLALAWLVTNEIFYSKHAKDEHQSKSEYLAACPQMLMQLLTQYRKHRAFRNYIPCSDTDNFMESHIDYVNQLFFGVHVQDWDSVQMTLQRLVSLGYLEGELPIIKHALGNPVQQGRESREAPEESEEQQEVDMATVRELILKRCRTLCERKFLYSLHEYLVMGIEAGHCGFNHFSQEVIGSMTKQRCSLNVESLRNLLLGFEDWTESVISYGLVTTPEHSIAPSFSSTKARLAENIQQLDKIYQETQEFLVRCFQDEVVHRTAGSASRKERTKKTRRGAGTARPAEESLPDAASTEASSVVVPADSKTVDAVATVEVEPVEREESFSDKENGWQQVKSGRRLIPAETALKDLSEALYGSDKKGAVAVLKTTNLNDACQQLQDRPRGQETDVLISLISGYLQVREMTSHVDSCMALTPEIQPFITLLDVRDQLAQDTQKRRQFIDAAKRFIPVDKQAQQALERICTHINTLLDLQEVQEEAETSSESKIAIMTAIEILAVPAQSLKEQLSNFREGIINVWKKYVKLLRRFYPRSFSSPAFRRDKGVMQAVMASNRRFQQFVNESEERLNLCQQRQESVSEARQPSSDSSRSPLQAQMTVPMDMDIASRLEVLNLSLEEIPSITVLGHRLDFIDHHTPDDASCMNMLARVASRLDIEISVYPFSSNTARELARVPNRSQTAQRPPLNKLFAQPFVFDDSERARSIREHFHMSIPAILADLNSSGTGMPVVLTGSAAFQYHVLSLWDKQQDSRLGHLYEQAEQCLPQGITLDHMQSSMVPRDTDLIVLNHGQFDGVLQRLETLLEQVCMAWCELKGESGKVIIADNIDIPTSFGTVITSGRVVVLSNTKGGPRSEIHYVIDVTKGAYPDQPSSEHYATRSINGSRMHIRRIDDIILDEVNIINPTSTGVSDNRRQKAITRLFMIAFLECQQPKLDSVSRMALLHALSSLPGEDPVITALAEQLRQRPFYIVCHEGRCLGARRTVPEQA